MKNLFYFGADDYFVLLHSGIAQQINGRDAFSIIPQPLILEPQQGAFVLDTERRFGLMKISQGIAELLVQGLKILSASGQKLY